MNLDPASFYRALLFTQGLFRYQKSIPTQVEERELTYPGLTGETVPMRQYRPRRTIIGSMIIYPGASPYAEEHPAMINFVRASARAGFNVFTPCIPPLKRLIIKEEKLLQWMAHIYRWVQDVPDVDPQAITLVGLSFGGALVLQAALQPEFQNPAPRSILAYGTYYNLQTALQFLATGDFIVNGETVHLIPDRWGLVVMLYNYLSRVDIGYSTKRLQALLAYAVQPNVTVKTDHLDSLTLRECELAKGLFFSRPTSELSRVMNCIYKQYQEEFEARSPKNWCEKIHYRVYVVHGSRDTMCPYTESLKLAQQLPNSVLLISHLHEHREITTGHGPLFMAREIGKLVRYLYDFFKEHVR